MSFQEAESALTLYAIGILNFIPKASKMFELEAIWCYSSSVKSD
jgi:hypothetical protein